MPSLMGVSESAIAGALEQHLALRRTTLERFEMGILAHALGPYGGPMLSNDSTCAWHRATLPCKMGGLGLTALSVELDSLCQLRPTHPRCVAAG